MRTLRLAVIACLGALACSAGSSSDPLVSARLETAAPNRLIESVATTARRVVNVQGRLDRIARDGSRYPAVDVKVRLNHPSYGPSTFTYTDRGGMYYFSGVPAGRFVLEVWLAPDYILRFQIDIPERPYFSIAPIVIP
jgi:hypothetical protein